MEKAGPVDVLINNAGIFKCADFSQTSAKEFDVIKNLTKILLVVGHLNKIIFIFYFKGYDAYKLPRKCLLH